MAKSYSATFQTALSATVNALVTCWKISLENGTVLGFTDSDRPLTIEGVTYAPDGGFQPSDIDRDLDFSPNQISLKSYFSQQLPLALFTSGRLRDAEVFVFRVDPYNLPSSLSATPLQYDPLIRGRLGKITLTDVGFTAEVSGLQERLGTRQGWVTSPTCRFRFCDSNCGLNIANFTDTITVASGSGRQSFTSTASYPNNRYLGGTLTWQTGANSGLSTSVVYSGGNVFRLLDPAYATIQAGDTATVTRNCGKTLSDCWGFGNGQRFGGEPGIPGGDSVAIKYSSDPNVG